MKPNKYHTFFTVIIGLLLQVQDQSHAANCHLEGVEDNAETYQVPSTFPESTLGDTPLWQTDTANIISSAVFPSPHERYITGLRYHTRYEYQATGNFSNFITNERTNEIERLVTFYCEDGETRQINFIFNLDDENNCAPEFPEEVYEFTVNKMDKPQDTDVVLVSGNIVVKDLDFLEQHAQVEVMSTHSAFIVEAVQTSKNPYVYNIRLSINWSRASLGTYHLYIMATDGKFARTKAVVVNAYP